MRLHNKLYELSGPLAIAVNGGKHPKRRILRYQEWFCEHIEPGWGIVDIGSNSGDMSAQMAEKAGYVYGIEIAQKLVSVARVNHAAVNLYFELGDATAFDYSHFRPIDCVTLSNVLEHIRERSAFLAMLLQSLPWRNPEKCYFLIRVPSIERDWLSVYKYEMGVEHRLDRTHEIEYTQEELFAELAFAGLEFESFDMRYGEYYAVCRGRVR